MSDLALGAEFPTPSHDAWLALVEKTLKGADFDEVLTSATYDGIPIAPLFTKADAHEEPAPPGSAPYTRGSHGHTDGKAWHICQSFSHPDPAHSNADILRDLKAGVSALVLCTCDAGEYGIHIHSKDDFARLLDGVLLDLAPVHLRTGAHGPAIAALYLAHVDRAGIDAGAVTGNLGLDPIGTLATTGTLPQSGEVACAGLGDLATHVDGRYPNLRTAVVDTTGYHFAGASEAQEIALALATGVAYLKAMEASGMELDRAAAQIGFAMTADTDFFSTIAKLRAARTVWAEVTAACGLAPAAMDLRVETASRTMSQRDPWVNMLRTTVACFAAGICGAENVTVHPYSAALGLPDGFARRIARNTQIILQEEASLGRVLDPAGGSWYVEHLTRQFADAAWRTFQDIESAGGMLAAVKSGLVQNRIAECAEARARNIATRRDALTGTSEFPDLSEPVVATVPVDRDAEHTAAMERSRTFIARRGPVPELTALRGGGQRIPAGALIDAAYAGATVGEIAAAIAGESDTASALVLRRLGAGFEALRDASDAWLAAHGSRPKVFLATLGPVASFTARAAYARNFFEAGGIQGVGVDSLDTPEAAAEAFTKSGARVAVICSSDTVYKERASATAAALTAAGAVHIYLAGAGGDHTAAFAAAGVGTFIHGGCDVVDVLRKAHSHIGVSES